MAKIRVGDIEIDGSHITIGGQTVISSSNHVVITNTTPAPPPQLPAPVSQELQVAPPRHDLAQLPGSPLQWVFAGVSLAFGSVLLGISAPYLLYVGFGLSILGVLKKKAHREEAHRARLLEEKKLLQLEVAVTPIVDKIRRALHNAANPMTVEQLARHVNISQTELIRGLVYLRRQEEVVEDLDVESGEWVYTLTKQLLPQNLDERLAALEEQEVKASRR